MAALVARMEHGVPEPRCKVVRAQALLGLTSSCQLQLLRLRSVTRWFQLGRMLDEARACTEWGPSPMPSL